MYSFIVTYRGRPEQLREYIAHIKQLYPQAEIIISEQSDTNIFKQGQLFNLAYPHSKGDIVILMDIDLRFTRAVDFEHCMQTLKWPFIGYNKIINVDVNGNQLGVRKFSNISHGGCCVFTRKQFEESSGFSNLMRGWGGEDDILNLRVNKYSRINNTLLHVNHPTRDVRNNDNYKTNVKVYKSDAQRQKELDGFKQTVADLITITISDNITHLTFNDIHVVDNFVYKDLLR